MANDKHTTSSLQRIPFHEDELLAIVDERTGKEYVLPKPMADIFGLQWPAQFTKLTRSKLFAKGVIKSVIPSAGGPQEAVLLERRLVHAWLFSIDVNRVAEPYQKKLLRYQEECAKVLDEYFTQKSVHPVVKNPSNQLMIDAVIRIDALEQAQLAQREALIAHQAMMIESQAKSIEALQLAAHAESKADTAMAQQQWLTIREYVYLHQIKPREFPETDWPHFGRYLTGYCQEHAIPVRTQGVGDRHYGAEHAYHVEVMAKLLLPWLHRRASQTALRDVSLRT